MKPRVPQKFQTASFCKGGRPKSWYSQAFEKPGQAQALPRPPGLQTSRPPGLQAYIIP